MSIIAHMACSFDAVIWNIKNRLDSKMYFRDIGTVHKPL